MNQEAGDITSLGGESRPLWSIGLTRRFFYSCSFGIGVSPRGGAVNGKCCFGGDLPPSDSRNKRRFPGGGILSQIPQYGKRFWRGIFFALLLLLLLGGWAAPAAAEIVFGIYTSDKPSSMYRKFSPIIHYLEQRLRDEGLPTKIRLKIYGTYSGAIDGLVEGEYDFGRFGPSSYILAKKRAPGIRLLCMEHKDGKKIFSGVWVTRKDSFVTGLSDLRGRRIAFGDKNSTIGRFLSQAGLVDVGIRAGDLASFRYLGRHDKVALAVAAGNYDAGPVKENTFIKYAASKGLRKIAEFPNVTKPWVVRAGFDDRYFDALKRAMLELTDKDVLKGLRQQGFLPAADGDYDFVRKGMERAGDF